MLWNFPPFTANNTRYYKSRLLGDVQNFTHNEQLSIIVGCASGVPEDLATNTEVTTR